MAGARYLISTIFSAKDKMSPKFKKMSKSASGFGSVLGGVLGADLIKRGFRALTQGVKSFIDESAKIEDAKAAFQPLLGGIENANAAIDALNETAASTPFQLETLAQSAKTLLGFGATDQEGLVKTLRMLGDTAGGSSERLSGISLAFGKIKALGKVTMREINQLINNGIPIFGELSEMIGVSAQEIQKMVSEGKITSDTITKAFQKMTSEGGKFYKGMEIASATFSGRMSTLKDNIALTQAQIADALMPVLKDLIDRGIELARTIRAWAVENKELMAAKVQEFVENVKTAIQNAIPKIKAAINTIKTIFKVLSAVSAVVKKLSPLIKGIVIAFAAYTAALKLAAIAQGILNLVMGANPIYMIIIAVGALIGVIIHLSKNWDTVKMRFNQFTQSVRDSMNALSAALAAFGSMIIKAILIPTNLAINGFQMLLILLSKLPGKAGKAFGGMNEGIQGFQDKMNKTLTGASGVLDFGGGAKNFFGKVRNVEDSNPTVGFGQSRDRVSPISGKMAPNKAAAERRAAEARSKIDFEGNINIKGAPPGTTIDSQTRGAPNVRMDLMGVNP